VRVQCREGCILNRLHLIYNYYHHRIVLVGYIVVVLFYGQQTAVLDINLIWKKMSVNGLNVTTRMRYLPVYDTSLPPPYNPSLPPPYSRIHSAQFSQEPLSDSRTRGRGIVAQTDRGGGAVAENCGARASESVAAGRCDVDAAQNRVSYEIQLHPAVRLNSLAAFTPSNASLMSAKQERVNTTSCAIHLYRSTAVVGPMNRSLDVKTVGRLGLQHVTPGLMDLCCVCHQVFENTVSLKSRPIIIMLIK